MHKPVRHAPDQVTKAYNLAMARTKAATSDLERMSDATLASIANSAVSQFKQPKQHAALLAELREIVAQRRAKA